MRILAWNIRHGGGAAQSLAPAIIAHDPDVVVLSEYREKTNTLIDQLRFFGWPHSVASPVTGDTNGVAIVAKHPLVKRPSPFGEAPFAWWGVEAAAGDISIIGLSAPLPATLKSSAFQREFWKALHRIAESRHDERILMIGDYNTCSPGVDGPNALACADEFDHLSTLGWVDAWRSCNPGITDFSYVYRAASGPSHWRLDHTFVSPRSHRWSSGAVTRTRSARPSCRITPPC